MGIDHIHDAPDVNKLLCVEVRAFQPEQVVFAVLARGQAGGDRPVVSESLKIIETGPRQANCSIVLQRASESY